VGYTGWVRLRLPDPEYLKLLLPYGEVIQKLALAVRKPILEEAPEAGEFVYEVYTIADHFTFTERPSDAFVFTTTHANWVNLGFIAPQLLTPPRPKAVLWPVNQFRSSNFSFALILKYFGYP